MSNPVEYLLTPSFPQNLGMHHFPPFPLHRSLPRHSLPLLVLPHLQDFPSPHRLVIKSSSKLSFSSSRPANFSTANEQLAQASSHRRRRLLEPKHPLRPNHLPCHRRLDWHRRPRTALRSTPQHPIIHRPLERRVRLAAILLPDELAPLPGLLLDLTDRQLPRPLCREMWEVHSVFSFS